MEGKENVMEAAKFSKTGSFFSEHIFLETLLNTASEQVLMIDIDGIVHFTNKDIFDTPKESAIGQNFYSLVPSTYMLLVKDKLKEAKTLLKSTSFETLFKSNGKLKSIETNIKPVFGDNNELKGFALTSVDTTEFKTARKRYEYKMNLEKLFLNISTKFINLPAEEIEQGINEALELMARFTNADHAYILLQNTASSKIDFEWHTINSIENDPSCNLKDIGPFLSEKIAKNDYTEPQLIPAHEVPNNLKKCPVFVCPMILEKKQYGALVLIGKSTVTAEWSDDFSKPMMLIANVFINTLERKKNALLEKRRQAELELIIKQRTQKIELQKEKLLEQASELKEAEAKIRAAYQELKKANFLLEKKVADRTSSLEKTNQELDRFVYSVSHDIKAPLASVLGLVNLIRISKGDEIETNLKLMERSINKLNGFVQDILEYSRNSRLTVKKDPINIKQQVESAREDLKHMELAEDVELITSYNIPTPVFSDESRLQSVLKNLLSNAVKYHNPDKEKSWVKVDVSADSKRIYIQISDNGNGIGEKSLPHVFDMFYRASEKSSGSGLGLYIVKETVQKMGGSIHVTSIENEGTTFDLTLPNLANA